MRDSKRIPEMVEVLRTLWEKHPDQRLGQLIVNVASMIDGFELNRPTALSLVEDDDMLDGLLRFAERPPSLPAREPWPSKEWSQRVHETAERLREQRQAWRDGLRRGAIEPPEAEPGQD